LITSSLDIPISSLNCKKIEAMRSNNMWTTQLLYNNKNLTRLTKIAVASPHFVLLIGKKKFRITIMPASLLTTGSLGN
jgi:hypothetical protein